MGRTLGLFKSKVAAGISIVVGGLCFLVILGLLVKHDGAYETLGIQRSSATTSSIKKAYRTMSKKYHPDKNKGPDAEAQFIDLSKAYEVLSKPTGRRLYEKFGHGYPSSPSDGEKRTEDSIQGEYIGIAVAVYIALAVFIYFFMARPMYMVWLGVLIVVMFYDLSAASGDVDPELHFPLPTFLEDRTPYQLAWLARGVLFWASLGWIVIARVNRSSDGESTTTLTTGGGGSNNTELAKEVKELRAEVKRLRKDLTSRLDDISQAVSASRKRTSSRT